MSKFGHLNKLEISKERTAEFTLYQLGSEPILILSPASESNKEYFNALLRRARKNIRVAQSGAMNAAILKQNRDEDRSLYAEYVVKGWKNVKDSNGNDVPFTRDDARDFLQALPDWIFDEIRQFASNIQNFIEDSIDVEEAAKN